jgi:hypothetical protein
MAHSGRASRQQPRQLSGVKRTSQFDRAVAANDPERTSRSRRAMDAGLGCLTAPANCGNITPLANVTRGPRGGKILEFIPSTAVFDDEALRVMAEAF